MQKVTLFHMAGLVVGQLWCGEGYPLTALRYRDEILEPDVRPYAGAIGETFLYSKIMLDHTLQESSGTSMIMNVLRS
jgi:hypothetical protein